jgi:anti-sigma factor ChrR (cupin superfamily)
MKHHTLGPEQETLAALYALGSLDAAEARDFERHLADDDCDVCRRQLDAMAGVCGDLAIAPSPATPSQALRSRILDEIGADASPSIAYTFRDDGEWIELKPGLSVKLLRPRSPNDSSRSYFVRLEPGAVLDRHTHRGTEHCYVVSGSTIVGGRRMGPGDYSYAARGSVHESIPTDEGAVLFIVETA